MCEIPEFAQGNRYFDWLGVGTTTVCGRSPEEGVKYTPHTYLHFRKKVLVLNLPRPVPHGTKS